VRQVGYLQELNRHAQSTKHKILLLLILRLRYAIEFEINNHVITFDKTVYVFNGATCFELF